MLVAAQQAVMASIAKKPPPNVKPAKKTTTKKTTTTPGSGPVKSTKKVSTLTKPVVKRACTIYHWKHPPSHAFHLGPAVFSVSPPSFGGWILTLSLSLSLPLVPSLKSRE